MGGTGKPAPAHHGRRRGKATGGVNAPQTEAELAEKLDQLSTSLKECNGPGWITTLIEAMRAEWGCTLEQAVFHESVNAAMVLYPALLARHGAEITVNHADKARQQAKAAKMAEIRAHFTIRPTTKKELVAFYRSMAGAQQAARGVKAKR